MEPEEHGDTGPGRGRRRALVTGVIAFLVLIAWSPLVATPALTPRLAILLVVAAAGLPVLIGGLRRPHPATIAAVFVVGWAVLSATWAGTALAWTGEYPLGTGAVFVAAVVSAWALARHSDTYARRGLVVGIVGGALVNAVVGLIQISIDTGIDELALVHDRATGLMGNPVFLGALAASAVPLLGTTVREHPATSAALAAVFAAATQVSGTRVALAGLAIGALVLAAGVRHRPILAAAMVAAVVAGVAAGGALTAIDGDHGRVATERLASAEGTANGIGQRVEIWQAGLAAAADRPIAGWGPGRFQTGASPHQGLRLARLAGPGRVFTDAHNLAIEHLATTGVVGLAALAAWLGLAGRESLRRRRLPLLGAVGVLLLFHALEPQNVAITPLLAAVLGAAGASEAPAPPITPRLRALAVVMVVPALGVGAVLLAGDARARVGVLDFDAGAAADASDLMPMWAVPVALEARISIFEHETTGDPAALERAVTHAEEAARREPKDPATLELHAAVLTRTGRTGDATAAWQRVLGANPWSVQALTALRDTWVDQRARASAQACDELLDLLDSSDDAPVDIDELRTRCRDGP